ncbi:MAG TPA: type I-MYXAN CRISPR-associated Cas8a1/Cmx1, partial [Acidobacteriota bacterium]|nr:type I-MYXAN CRISPR-associated Cas8a1/Cmx1 [Acidobacteriota bacterium]
FSLDHGLITFTGLKGTDLQNRVLFQQGLRGTFLQHSQTFQKEGIATRTFHLDENGAEITFNYQFLSWFIHQDFAESLCDSKGTLRTEPISVAGWLNPGATVRHVAFPAQTGFEETPANALVLLFAPMACQYFLLRSKLRDKRAQYAVVVPEITDLELFARRRWHFVENFGVRDFHASNLGDAGMRFLVKDQAAAESRMTKAPRCQVITFGTVDWSAQQKSRTQIHVLEASEKVCELYRTASEYFPDRPVKGKEGTFLASSFARELIAENLSQNLPWFAGLSDKVTSGEAFKILSYEKEGLHNMAVDKSVWTEESERLFVQACHEAFRLTYRKIYSRARDIGEVANLERANERFRTELGRCKNADSFRAFITDFWSRAGQIPTLQEHWRELLALTTGQHSWKTARDLALLALASYKGTKSSTVDVVEEFE